MIRLRLILFALVVWTGGLITLSQTTNRDFYAYLHGDIWKFSIAQSSATSLTNSGYNGGPTLSPDGSKFAFLETAPTFLVQFNAGTAAQTAGTPPADIWIYDIASQTFTSVADQTGASPAGFLRSVPAWSPDSRQLAWLQIDPYFQTPEQATLQVYSLETRLSANLVEDINLGSQQSSILMPTLLWGDGGIAHTFLVHLQGNQSPLLFVEILDASNGDRTRYNLQLAADNSNLVRDLIWATHQGRAALLLGIGDYWEVLDPLDGSRFRLSDPPRLKNSFIAGGMELIPRALANESGGWEFHWHALSGGNSYDTGYSSSDVDVDSQPTLSSDGRQMVWHSGDRVSTWHTGISADARPLASNASANNLFPIPGPVSVVWAPTQWVTTGGIVNGENASAAPSAPNLCTLTPLLSPGQRAIVSPGLANRVRSAASLDAVIIGNIQASEVVDVLQGPICNRGYYWYRVQNERISGWTVEGIDGDYWLLYHIDCPQSPPTRLTKGMTAVVLPGLANFVRDGVGTNGTDILGRLAAGTRFEITDHPQCDTDGMRWYPIQNEQISGWTAAGSGDEYWIEPAPPQATG